MCQRYDKGERLRRRRGRGRGRGRRRSGWNGPTVRHVPTIS